MSDELGKEMDCEECIPDLFEENSLAFKIFVMVRDQHIMGFGGPVDLNLQAFFSVVDAMQVEGNARMELLAKVKMCYNQFVKYSSEEEKAKRALEKNKPKRI